MHVLDYTMTGADVDFILDNILGLEIVLFIFMIIGLVAIIYISILLTKICKRFGINPDEIDETHTEVKNDENRGEGGKDL